MVWIIVVGPDTYDLMTGRLQSYAACLECKVNGMTLYFGFGDPGLNLYFATIASAVRFRNTMYHFLFDQTNSKQFKTSQKLGNLEILPKIG